MLRLSGVAPRIPSRPGTVFSKGSAGREAGLFSDKESAAFGEISSENFEKEVRFVSGSGLLKAASEAAVFSEDFPEGFAANRSNNAR